MSANFQPCAECGQVSDAEQPCPNPLCRFGPGRLIVLEGGRYDGWVFDTRDTHVGGPPPSGLSTATYEPSGEYDAQGREVYRYVHAEVKAR